MVAAAVLLAEAWQFPSDVKLAFGTVLKVEEVRYIDTATVTIWKRNGDRHEKPVERSIIGMSDQGTYLVKFSIHASNSSEPEIKPYCLDSGMTERYSQFLEWTTNAKSLRLGIGSFYVSTAPWQWVGRATADGVSDKSLADYRFSAIRKPEFMYTAGKCREGGLIYGPCGTGTEMMMEGPKIDYSQQDIRLVFVTHHGTESVATQFVMDEAGESNAFRSFTNFAPGLFAFADIYLRPVERVDIVLPKMK